MELLYQTKESFICKITYTITTYGYPSKQDDNEISIDIFIKSIINVWLSEIEVCLKIKSYYFIKEKSLNNN